VLDARDELVLATDEARRLFGLLPGGLGRSVYDLGLPAQLYDYFDVPAPVRRRVLALEVSCRTVSGERLLEVCISPIYRAEAMHGTSISFQERAGRRVIHAHGTATRVEARKVGDKLHAAIEELEIGIEKLRSMSRAVDAARGDVRLAIARMERMSDQLELARQERRRVSDELTRQGDRLEERASWVAGILHLLAGRPNLTPQPSAVARG
jgi:hypothetical protein